MKTKAKKDAPTKSRVKSKRGVRDKGKVHERAVAEELRQVWKHAQRGIGQVRASGEVPDVDRTPFWIETKHHAKAPNVFAAMAQAIAAHDEYDRTHERDKYPAGPLVIAKKTNSKPEIVAMPMEMFIDLIFNLKVSLSMLRTTLADGIVTDDTERTMVAMIDSMKYLQLEE